MIFLEAVREVIAGSDGDQKYIDRGVKALVTIFRHLDRWFTAAGGDSLRRTTSSEARRFNPGQTLKEAAARLQKEPTWTPSFGPAAAEAPVDATDLERTPSLQGLERTVSANTSANLAQLATFLDEQAATWEQGSKPSVKDISLGHTLVYCICAESGEPSIRTTTAC